MQLQRYETELGSTKKNARDATAFALTVNSNEALGRAAYGDQRTQKLQN